MAITIPKETLLHWKSLRGKDDVKRLQKLLKKKNASGVYYLLSTGKCSTRSVAAKLVKFHSELEEELKAITKQLDQD